MGWKELRSWIKGGIIGTGFAIIFFVIPHLMEFLRGTPIDKTQSIFFFIVNLLFLIVYILPFAIIGVLFGLLIQCLKDKPLWLKGGLIGFSYAIIFVGLPFLATISCSYSKGCGLEGFFFAAIMEITALPIKVILQNFVIKSLKLYLSLLFFLSLIFYTLIGILIGWINEKTKKR